MLAWLSEGSFLPLQSFASLFSFKAAPCSMKSSGLPLPELAEQCYMFLGPVPRPFASKGFT